MLQPISQDCFFNKNSDVFQSFENPINAYRHALHTKRELIFNLFISRNSTGGRNKNQYSLVISQSRPQLSIVVFVFGEVDGIQC